MKVKDIRALGAEELEAKVNDLNNELFDLRMRLKTGRLDSTAEIRATRRDLARVQTILRERQLGIQRGA